jgi:hypothetical protein
MADPTFTLHGAITSTGGSATLLVINGPTRRALDGNAGSTVFGPGWHANATIGRAIRLVTLNCLGTLPGVLDRSTQGHPGKYTFCIAVVAGGGPGGHSAFIPSWSRARNSLVVTREIKR